MTPVHKRSAIKPDLFAAHQHREKLHKPGDPLTDIEAHIDFGASAASVDEVAPRPVSTRVCCQVLWGALGKIEPDSRNPVARVSISTCTPLSWSSCNCFHLYTAAIGGALNRFSYIVLVAINER